jgi:hypothetical protein
MESETSVRIRAAHIRKRLRAKNGSPYFRQTLAALSDEELVRMDAEHHARKLQWVSEQGGAKKSHGRI